MIMLVMLYNACLPSWRCLSLS